MSKWEHQFMIHGIILNSLLCNNDSLGPLDLTSITVDLLHTS